MEIVSIWNFLSVYVYVHVMAYIYICLLFCICLIFFKIFPIKNVICNVFSSMKTYLCKGAVLLTVFLTRVTVSLATRPLQSPGTTNCISQQPQQPPCINSTFQHSTAFTIDFLYLGLFLTFP